MLPPPRPKDSASEAGSRTELPGWWPRLSHTALRPQLPHLHDGDGTAPVQSPVQCVALRRLSRCQYLQPLNVY